MSYRVEVVRIISLALAQQAGQNAEWHDIALGSLPVFQQRPHSHGFVLFQMDQPRLLAVCAGLPLIERISGYTVMFK